MNCELQVKIVLVSTQDKIGNPFGGVKMDKKSLDLDVKMDKILGICCSKYPMSGFIKVRWLFKAAPVNRAMIVVHVKFLRQRMVAESSDKSPLSCL